MDEDPINDEHTSILAARLGHLSGELNKRIATVEAKLKSLNLGIEVWIQMGPGGNHLGYGKVNGEWRLLWMRAPTPVEMVEGTSPDIRVLKDEAPRVERIAALGWIPGLMNELRHRAENLIDKLTEALQ